jgi:SAM-dependent methyltransferase
MNNQFHLAPITSNPQRILDLGTGSGIWAIDMADRYPSAGVIGTDTAPVQPFFVPPNVQFEIADVEEDWLWRKDSFDFIHARELIMAIHDWPRLIQQALEHLRPGGYLQLAGSVPMISSDDDTLPADSAYVELSRIYFEMGERIGASGNEPLRWKEYLEAAGFTDVVERVLKVPTNPWPKDPRLKQIGALELTHFRDGIRNIFARGFTQILGGDSAYLEVLMAHARKEVGNRKMHTYVPL